MIKIQVQYKDGSMNEHELAKGLSDKDLTKVFDFLECLLTTKVRAIHPDGKISKEF